MIAPTSARTGATSRSSARTWSARTGRVSRSSHIRTLSSMLTENVSTNGLSQVEVLRVAAGAAAGRRGFIGFDAQAGNWGLSRTAQAAGDADFEYETAVPRCAARRQGVDRVDLVKIDIEGGRSGRVARDDRRSRPASLSLRVARVPSRRARAYRCDRRRMSRTIAPRRLSRLANRSLRRDASPRAVSSVPPLRALARRSTRVLATDPWPHLLLGRTRSGAAGVNADRLPQRVGSIRRIRDCAARNDQGRASRAHLLAASPASARPWTAACDQAEAAGADCIVLPLPSVARPPGRVRRAEDARWRLVDAARLGLAPRHRCAVAARVSRSVAPHPAQHRSRHRAFERFQGARGRRTRDACPAHGPRLTAHGPRRTARLAYPRLHGARRVTRSLLARMSAASHRACQLQRVWRRT